MTKESSFTNESFRVREHLNLGYHGLKESEKPAMFQEVRDWLREMDDTPSPASAAPVDKIVAENLRAIVVRCEDGDKRADWLPVIAKLAREALGKLESPAAATAAPVEQSDALRKRARQIIDAVIKSPVVVEVRAFSQPEEVDKLENQIIALLQRPPNEGVR